MTPLLRWLRPSRRTSPSRKHSAAKTLRAARLGYRVCSLEALESRALLSAASLSDLSHVIATPAVSGSGYTAAQVTSAYLANNLSLITKLKGSITGNGAGQTIAIVDAYNDPNIASDLATFDAKFGLTAANLSVVSETGSTSKLPATDAGWSLEISLDVEWAHAIAPGANILLVEANSASFSDLLTAVKYAASYSGVSVVSMSWGTNEFNGETSYDSYFTSPAGHGVTFVASSGDSGVTSWPSVSSSVLAVGGTTLTLSSSGVYAGETAWSDSGGGVSKYEAVPSYQKMIGVSATGRVTPDVSYDANPSSGFLVYDSVPGNGSTGWIDVGGTSAGAPQWAGIIAIANQGRVANGLGTLTQANAMLYTLYATKSAADFHDITSGSNTSRFSAAKGFDAVTGLGSPIISSLVSDMAVATATSTTTSITPITIGPVGGSRGGGGWGGGWGGWGWGGWSSGWYSGFGMAAIASSSLPLGAYTESGASASSPLSDPAAGIGLTMTDAGSVPSAVSTAKSPSSETAALQSSALPGRFSPKSSEGDATGSEEYLPTVENAWQPLVAAPSSALHNRAVDQIFGDFV